MTASETPDELRARLRVAARITSLRSPEPDHVDLMRQAADAIDALLARLTAAEAERDELRALIDGIETDVHAEARLDSDHRQDDGWHMKLPGFIEDLQRAALALRERQS